MWGQSRDCAIRMHHHRYSARSGRPWSSEGPPAPWRLWLAVLLAAASLPCATLAYTYAFLAAGTAAIVPPVLLLAGGWRSLRAGGLG